MNWQKFKFQFRWWLISHLMNWIMDLSKSEGSDSFYQGMILIAEEGLTINYERARLNKLIRNSQ